MSAKAAVSSDFRLAFTSSSGGETIRAFLIFGVLLTILVGIAIQLAFREVGVGVLTTRLDIARNEALQIAAKVTELGADAGGIDFSRVRDQEAAFRQFVNQRFAQRVILHHVEVRDRFGVLQVLVSRHQGPDAPQPRSPVGVDLSDNVVLRARKN